MRQARDGGSRGKGADWEGGSREGEDLATEEEQSKRKYRNTVSTNECPGSIGAAGKEGGTGGPVCRKVQQQSFADGEDAVLYRTKGDLTSQYSGDAPCSCYDTPGSPIDLFLCVQ